MTGPRYVAIITDGNGRWAQRRGLDVAEGHQAGADTVKARLRDAVDLGIDRNRAEERRTLLVRRDRELLHEATDRRLLRHLVEPRLPWRVGLRVAR